MRSGAHQLARATPAPLRLSLLASAIMCGCGGLASSSADAGARDAADAATVDASSGACSRSADCASGRVCAYDPSARCGATGHCITPTPNCCGLPDALACGCDGRPDTIHAAWGQQAERPVRVPWACQTQCGATACQNGDVCVITLVGNGIACPVPPTDAGLCPPGFTEGSPEMSGCCWPTTYTCMPAPAGCTSLPDCACAAPTFCGRSFCADVVANTVRCDEVH
jgi:hypothetical protein